MLKSIDPLIGPDLLRILALMGHGDEIVIADANFPAASVAAHCTIKEPIFLPSDAISALRAILSLLPLDSYGQDPVLTMEVVGAPDEIPPVVSLAAPIFANEGFQSKALERFAFYDKAKQAFAIVATTETRIYANFILRKGVIAA